MLYLSMQTAYVTEQSNAETATIAKYDGLVQALARRFLVQVEDLEQIGRIALLEADRDWRTKSTEGHTATFQTYARKCVFTAMLRHTTRELARSRIEIDSGCGPGGSVDPDLVLEAREHLAALSEDERKIVIAFVSGVDVRSIAEDLGMSKSSVHRTLSDALENLRERA